LCACCFVSFLQSYITFGEPNLKTVRELVYKRGFAKINKQRLPLTDNKLVEDALGKYGIVCVEVCVRRARFACAAAVMSTIFDPPGSHSAPSIRGALASAP
jgi:hypothetical protein